MRSLEKIPVLKNIPVLVRAALNVPIEKGEVVNDYRLRRALPTLQYLSKHGARVIVASHIGEAGTETLAPVAKALAKLVPGVSFCESTIKARARKAVRELPAGGILVLENLRRNPGEVKNDLDFAHELAALADVFVQDSFDTCHRVHASMVRVPRILPSYAGLELIDEVRELTKALKPKHPSLAIIGGAKFSTKEPILKVLLERYDHVFVGGALANDFIKAAGYEVGRSLVSNGDETAIKALLHHPRLILPSDVCLVTPRGKVRIAGLGDAKLTESILDCGTRTAEQLAILINQAKTVLWNGPLGMYEKGFVETTDAVAKAIGESKAYSIVGGGDTVAEIERAKLLDGFSFVSIGGGAMLDFLSKGTLPGIQALG